MTSWLRVDALCIFVRYATEDFNFPPGQTVTLGMGVAHHKPDPLGFERAAHVLFHVIEDLLQASFEIRLNLFNVRTVTHKILSHCCYSFQANDDFSCTTFRSNYSVAAFWRITFQVRGLIY